MHSMAFPAIHGLTGCSSGRAFGTPLTFNVSPGKSRASKLMVFAPAFTLARVHPLGVWPCVGLRLQSLRQFQAFFASSARQSSASSYGVGSALHSRPILSPGLTLRSSRPPTAAAYLGC